MQIGSITEAMDYLVELGVKKLGADYPACNKKNIMTDLMYGQFFKQSLLLTKENLPRAKQVNIEGNKKVLTYYFNGITLLVAKINKNLNLTEDDKH